MKLSRWRRFQVAAIAALGYPIIALVGRTLRWRVEGMHHLEHLCQRGRTPIYALWHDRILAFYYLRHRGIVVIVSESFDGEWVARILQWFGYGTVRGSTSRGGRRAIIRLKRALADGRATGITVDGPRGPAQRAQAGAIWLASASGQPILPVHVEAARYWTAGGWDRTQIPKPFSQVALAIGTPLEVPADLADGLLEAKRQELEGALNGLSERVCQMLKA